MIHILAKHLQGVIPRTFSGCVVEYGAAIRWSDEHPVGTFGIALQRDKAPTELISAPVSAHQPSRMVRLRTYNGTATIYARAEQEGALEYENEAICDRLVDAAICEITDWVTAQRLANLTFPEARHLRPDERGGGEVFGGAVYRLRFSIAQGVYKPTPLTGRVGAVITATPPSVQGPG